MMMTVTVEWEMLESVCEQTLLNTSRSVAVDITNQPYMITELEDYSSYNITVCVQNLLVCNYVIDSTAQSGIVRYKMLTSAL